MFSKINVPKLNLARRLHAYVDKHAADNQPIDCIGLSSKCFFERICAYSLAKAIN